MSTVVVGGYVLFGRGQDTPQRHTSSNVQIVATANIPAEGTPAAPFAAVDPAVMNAFLNTNPITNPVSTSLILESAPPIGIYLPSNQSVAPPFQLQDLEVTGLSPLNNELLANPKDIPVVSPLAGSVEITAYGGDDCAPAGLPVSGVLTQRFHTYHSGIDIGVPLGTPVQATQSGNVIFAGWSAYGYGYLVIIQNGAFITYYAHLTNFNVQTGDQVGAGSIIAWSGSTGNSTGPHVHYETRINDVPVDPLTFEGRGNRFC